MKNLAFLLLLTLGLCPLVKGQEFSLDDLSKLRNTTYPEFETKVQDKGYQMEHLEHNERCTIFRKNTNVLSYCHIVDNGYSYHTHVAVKLETSDKALYEKLKAEAESSMTYYKTKLRRHTHEHYMEHIYANDDITVHLYNITFDDSEDPYYEIEIRSIYAPY